MKVFQFNIKSRLDEKTKSQLYSTMIKTQIYHINSALNGRIWNTYLCGLDGKQSLLGLLCASFQYFVLNDPKSPARSELASEYNQNRSLFYQNCEKWTEQYALKEFPKNTEYLFENEFNKKSNNDKIEVLCSLGRYIEINKEEFNLNKVFELLGITDFDRWSFIVGNNTYLNNTFIKENIIDEIKKIGKFIIFPRSRC